MRKKTGGHQKTIILNQFSDTIYRSKQAQAASSEAALSAGRVTCQQSS